MWSVEFKVRSARSNIAIGSKRKKRRRRRHHNSTLHTPNSTLIDFFAIVYIEIS